MRYCKDGKLFNFLHIPRTGGRFVAEILINNGYEAVDACYANCLYTKDYKTLREIIHLDYKQSRILYGDGLTSFTIMRDPIQRFLSGISKIPNISLDELEDWNKFVWFMEEWEFVNIRPSKGLYNSFNSWFVHQYHWIGNNVHVWKYEDGFESTFKQWLYDQVGLTLTQVQVSNIPQHSASEMLCNNIANYYADDYAIYNKLQGNFMGDVIQFKKKETLEYSPYTVDKFTMTWENAGLSYEGTIQTEYIIDQSTLNRIFDNVQETME